MALHLVRNVHARPAFGTPLLLGIHGNPGVGKSFQLDAVLREIGVAVTAISSSELESDRANDPARLIRRKYLDAAASVETQDVAIAAIVINDIDAAIGDWGSLVQYTVNRQAVMGELMHLCDRPSAVQDTPNKRVPIFVTANDFSKMYQPLVRSGRMRSFRWEPTADEMTDALLSVLPGLSRAEVNSLVDAYPCQPISFFVDALNYARDLEIGTLFSSHGLKVVLSAAMRGQLNNVNEITLDALTNAAHWIAAEQADLKDFSSV
ncbi:AAA family ATPase [Gordonia iterans]